MTRSLLPYVAAAVLIATTASGAAKKVGPSQATFTGKGPAGFKLEGKTTELELDDDGTNVTIKVPLAKLDTGIELRNRHMREKYLEVDKYPHATLVAPRSTFKLPADGQTSQGEGKGKMTIHGQTKDVSFKYTLQRKGAQLYGQGQVPLNLKDFNINIPSYLGVTVKPDIETSVTFQFTE
jgi:polyisoprenoid-binding protein YceI